MKGKDLKMANKRRGYTGRGYTSEQIKQIRIVKNAINRTKKLLSEFGNKAEVTQVARLQLSSIGIDDIRKPLSNKEIANLNVKQHQLKSLEKIKTLPQAYSYYAKQVGIEYNRFSTTNDLQGIVDFAELDYDMHQFINDNIDLIYDYERENGNVITGKKSQPTWEELLKMKQEIITQNKKEDLNINVNYLPND